MAAVFMPDRERKANNTMARELEDMVLEALKHDERYDPLPTKFD